MDSLFISADAPGTITWQLTSKPAWASVSPSSGVATARIDRILVTADSTGLPVGTHKGAIEIISTGGAVRAGVGFQVSLHPRVHLSSAMLDFGDHDTLRTLVVKSVGNGRLAWTISSDSSWCLAVNVQGGYLDPGDSSLINIAVRRHDKDSGMTTTALTVHSNADTGNERVSVSMRVLPAAILVPSDSAMSLGFLRDSLIWSLRNSGNISATFQLSPSTPFLSCSPAQGALNRGESASIILKVDRESAPSDTVAILGSIGVAGGTSGAIQIPVRLFNYRSELWPLAIQLKDAEFCRATGMIVAVSDLPPQLHVIDPQSKTIKSAGLSLTPNCVAVRVDGTLAVVGHNALMSVVNLTTMVVEYTWSVPCDAIDIILPQNGWAYTFPRRDQWSSIYCTQLSNGLVLPHRGFSIYAGTVGRLHPSDDYIYGANNGLSPSDFEKYDIRTDTLIYMYDSRYHGDYAFNGDLWISENGERLFARSGNIFTSSPDPSRDIIYSGAFAGISYITWAEHSAAAGRVYLLANQGSWWEPLPTCLFSYEDDFFSYRGRISLPKFVAAGGNDGQLLSLTGKFVFATADGTKLFVLGTGPTGSPKANDWATAIILTAEQP
ncbi:MAG: hypothetical protein HY851_00345 [candidate division Zixibacteria bacterium]|nr:hypothetical protein [candidate division Zixibacteria bacterium]